MSLFLPEKEYQRENLLDLTSNAIGEGFYCPEGSQMPKACPANTIRRLSGARQLEDCSPCPAGYWCKEGDPQLYPCPAGHYCDGLNQTHPGSPAGPQKCPMHTFYNLTAAASRSKCHPCPAGFHCNETGIITFENFPCPLGFWCPGSGKPYLCPAGMFRSKPGAASDKECYPCIPGYYCPDPTLTGQPNTYGVPCQASYECPSGSTMPKICRAGSYCGPQTGFPPACPAGFFCPEGSHSYNTPAQM
ncbi:multiple epidermal growth factor-like domains protein 10 [Protopterus annectens]|uniref:multiple epidermal growth factor-like domains protein 10 n=1 Tax=Protopterus annectens TaxID=7888 RepID=UPI001CFB3381|nr:multiple epidermal growth factor-like domains protein 10 [Protopterus annectens]